MVTKSAVYARIEQLRPELERIAGEIYDNPECKYEEFKAAELLCREAKHQGFAVEHPLAGLGTAFRAKMPGKTAGPGVAFLAEYDALPVIGHACGHHLIAAAAVGAAGGLAGFMDVLPGRLEIIGTPAEEGGGGKVALAQAGVFDGLDAALMFHPSAKNILKRGSLARRKLKMDFFGKSSHAAAAPEKGINALDAVILSFNNINALRQHLCEDVRIHGVIPDGGEVPNVVPDYASALFYVRARDDEYCDAVLAKVEECARAAALATGCRVELAMQGAYRAIKVDEQLLALFRQNSESLGVVYDSSIDPDKNLGSTDMGDVSHLVPAIHPYLCIGEPDMAGHTREFLQAGMSDKALDTMVVAAKSLAATALDILLQGRPGGAPE